MDTEEISLLEIIEILKKNMYFILSVTILTILLALSFSVVKDLSNPMTYRYKALAKTMIKNTEGFENQDLTALNLYTSLKIKEDVKADLKIKDGNYQVEAEYGSVPKEIIVQVEGPDKNTVVKLVDGIVAKTHGLVVGSKIVEKGVLSQTPIVNEVKVNYMLNIIIGMVLGVMVSIFIIFALNALNTKVRTEEQLKMLLGAKVFAIIPNTEEDKYSKYYKVR